MKNNIDPPKDDFYIRCPRLGHQIGFKFCESENKGVPCFKTLDCWYTHFDVETFMKNKLSEEEWKKAFVQKGKPKVASLLELIEKAKTGKKEKL